MKLICINSNSSGNGYILTNGKESLVIELGRDWKEYEKSIGYNIENVKGCICTHLHFDHSNPKTINKILSLGIDVYSCKEVADKYSGVKEFIENKKYTFGGFKVQVFQLFHNVQNIGFLIDHEDMGRMLFATDTNAIPYRFKGINHFCVEANYSDDVIVDNAINNEWNSSQSQNHFSIEQCIDFIKENFSGSCQNIILCHLSSRNSNGTKFINDTKRELGFDNVFIAQKNKVFELNKDDF